MPPKVRRARPRPTVQVSDYESDVQIANVPQRTNAELNLSVLSKYNPSIRSILSIAASAVIYNYNPPSDVDPSGSWEKAGIDGPLFVCKQESNPITGADRFCMVILNRKGLENLIIDFDDILMVELTGEYLLIITPTIDGGSRGRGLWMHKDKDDTREINNTLIEECWNKVVATKAEASAVQMEQSSSNESWNIVAEQPTPTIGRKLSLRDLFRAQ